MLEFATQAIGFATVSFSYIALLQYLEEEKHNGP